MKGILCFGIFGREIFAKKLTRDDLFLVVL
jgi:hypothetical protein